VRRLAALLLVLAAARAGAERELEPRTEFVTTYAVLGAAATGVLGASLGALSRPAGDAGQAPLKLWGGVGAGMGLVLGWGAGRDAALRPRLGPEGALPHTGGPATVLGMLAGELAGLAGAAATSRPLDWDAPRLYAGLALGAAVGAVAGALLPPLAVLGPPAAESDERRRETREEAFLPPPAAGGGREFLAAHDRAPGPAEPVFPAPASRLRALGYALMTPEDLALMPSSPARLLAPSRPDVAAPLAVPEALAGLVRSTTALGLAAGAAVGAAAGGAIASAPGDARRNAAGGAALGALTGWLATAAFAEAWSAPVEGGYPDLADRLAEGRRASAVLAGGLLGGLSGGAAGLAAANYAGGIGAQQVAQSALAGALLGLATGAVLSER